MFLGREHELAALGQALARNGAVAVVGEAGVGKTALLREAANLSRRQLFEGGGLSALSWMEHLPLVRALGRNLHSGDAAAVAAFVAEEVGDGVLILDDLQWADHATVRVLRFLAGRVGLLCALRRGDPSAATRGEELTQARITLIGLEGLASTDAAELVRQQRSDLSGDAVNRIVEAERGNPLLVEQLTLLNGSFEALRLGLGARLRPHSPAAQEAVARLALLGRPAEPRLVGNHAGSLLQAGLLVERDGRLELRHQLLGDAALEGFDSSGLLRLHSELAQALSDPGEAARHHAKAGELSAAYEKALDAAANSVGLGERASHLKVAATAAAGSDADRLRLEAAEALVETGDYSGALELTAAIQAGDPEVVSRASLADARAWRHRGNREAAERAIAAGLDCARGSGTPAEVELRLEEVGFLINDWDGTAPRHAAAALKLARSAGAAEARAQLMLAFAEGDRDARLGVEYARTALEMARQEEDGSLECEAAQVLADCLINDARASEAYLLITTIVERARELGLRSRELELLHVQASLELFSRGEVDKANELFRSLLRERAVLGERLIRTQAYLAYGLASLGHDREASEVLDEASAGMNTADDRAVLSYARSEAQWLAGRLHAALLAVEPFRREGAPFEWAVTAVAGWTAFELGTDQPDLSSQAPAPVVAGAVQELHALSCLASSRPQEAEQLFQEAAHAWQGCFVQAELRCLWGAGLAALQAGDVERGRKRLLAAERQAQRGGLAPLLARIQRSLRKAGVQRSSARRPSTDLLTAREQEVLDLVGAGLKTREIAARLGVAPSTVNSQVKSAMRKLGSRTRTQAALAVADAKR